MSTAVVILMNLPFCHLSSELNKADNLRQLLLRYEVLRWLIS